MTSVKGMHAATDEIVSKHHFCDPPPKVTNAHVLDDMLLYHRGDWIVYQCNPRYKMTSGSNTNNCMTTGTWLYLNPTMKCSRNDDDIDIGNPVIDDPKELGTTLNDRMKQLITGLVGLVSVEGIPVGKFISVLISFFWPDSAVDIWELIKRNVEEIVDKKILIAEMHEIQSHINGLKKTMQQYVEAKPHEKGSLMSAIIQDCNNLHYRIFQCENAVQLIPLAVTVSYMQLTALKERLVHGKTIYTEDNTEVWYKELEKEIQTYREDFEKLYTDWRQWRQDSIVVKFGEHKVFTTVIPFFNYIYTGEVTDHLTGQTRSLWANKMLTISNPTYFKQLCEAIKAMMWNKANGAMIQTVVPAFLLENFMPGSENNLSNPIPLTSTVSLGPFSPNVLSGSGDPHVLDPPYDKPTSAPITQIIVREWNLIDGLQFIYNGSEGSFYGNPNGGMSHQIDVKNRHVQKVKFSFNNLNMVDIEFIFSDGQSSGKLGDRSHWNVMRVEAGGIDSFGLDNVKIGTSVNHIEFLFKHFNFRPSDVPKLDSV